MASPATGPDVAAVSRTRELELQVAQLKAENRSLRDELRAGREVAKRALGGSRVQECLFEESMTGKRDNIRRTRQLQLSRRAFVAAREHAEQLEMAAHDPFAVASYAEQCLAASDSGATSFGGVSELLRPGGASSTTTSAASLSGSYGPARRVKTGTWQTLRCAVGYSSSRQLQRLFGDGASASKALDMPELESAEAYLKARIGRSAFQQPLSELRESTVHAGRAAYGAVATQLGDLEGIFKEAQKPDTLLACPAADFKNACRDLLSKVGAQLKAVRREVESACGRLLDRENAIAKERRAALVDGASQVTREDMLLMDGLAKLAAAEAAQSGNDGGVERAATTAAEWEARYRVLEKRCASLERSLGQQRAKAKAAEEQHQSVVASEQTKLNSLVDAVFRVHDAAYRAVHAVFKHRFKWCPSCPNHFVHVRRTPSQRRDSNADDASSVVTFWRNAHIVEITEAARRDEQLLGDFAAYFVNDNLFGSDVLHATRHGHLKPGFVAFAEDAPIGAGDDHTGGGKENDRPAPKQRPRSASAAQPMTAGSGAQNHNGNAPGSARGFRRMEQWQQQQAAKWSERRASQVSTGAPANVKLDETPTKPAVAAGSAAHAAATLTPRAVVQTMSLTPTEPALPVPPARHDFAGPHHEPFRRRHSSAF